MRIGGSILAGPDDSWGTRGFGDQWGWHHREDLTVPDQLPDEGISRAEAYGILAPLSPVKGGEWWNIDRATRSFPLVIDGETVPATCVWEPNLIQKGDVKVHLNGGANGAEENSFTVHGNIHKGGLNVTTDLAKALEALRPLEGNAEGLMGFDVGSGEYVAENGDWDEVAEAGVYRKGAPNDLAVMNRAAYLYEIMARFTDALDFLIRRIVRESGQRPRNLRDKMVNVFVIPVVVGGKMMELTGELVGKHFPLEARVEMEGELKIGDGKTIKFRQFNGSTTPNFVEDDAFFAYQEVENIVRQVEIMDGEITRGGLNNFGSTRLYGKQRKDDGGSRGAQLQHFLNEGGNIEGVVVKLGRMVAVLEGLRGIFDGEVGKTRESVRREVTSFIDKSPETDKV